MNEHLDHAPQDTATHHPDDATLPALDRAHVLVIGAGNMGGPVVRALLRSGISPENLMVRNSSEESSQRAAEELGTTTRPIAEALPGADLVVLGVKPYQVLDVCDDIADGLRPDAIVVSLAAGVTLAQLAEHLPEGQPLLRVMPNTPVGVGEGAAALMPAPSLTDAQDAWIRTALAGAGTVVTITEDQVHAFIGAAGSGVAYVFTVVEAMIDEAVRLGLKRPLAEQIVVQTVIGAGTMLRETGTHPAIARNNVCSPGGTTALGVAELERGGLRATLGRAMEAAADTSRRMAGE